MSPLWQVAVLCWKVVDLLGGEVLLEKVSHGG